MGKLILVRHGQTDMNKDRLYFGKLDPSLNAEGRSQAIKACHNLVGLDIDYDKIYSSNQKRAYETAVLVNYKKLDIEQSELIQEMDFGIFEGLTYNEIIEKYPEEMEKCRKDWKNYSYVNGENPIILQKRAIEFINSLDKNLNNLVVTHWGIICSLLSYFLSNGLDSYWKFEIKNGGIAVIEFQEGFPILRGFNIGG